MRTRTELAALFRLAWPMIATQMFIMGTGFLDTAMAGHYSAKDLAGVALAGNVLWPLFLLLTGITMALTPIAAQLAGAGQTEHVGARTRQGLWIAGIAAAILMLCISNCRWLFDLTGITPEVADIATQYLDAVCWGIPAVVFYVALRNTCEGLGHTRPPMVIAGSVLPVNAFLNYALIYGEFGFPELGGVGCGYATAVIFWLELILMVFVVRQPFFHRTQTFSQFALPDLQEILRTLKVGVPIGLTIFLEMSLFSVVGFLVASIGTIELAAHSIAGNLNWMTYVIPSTLGAAAGIRVGHFVGADDLNAARNSAGVAYRFCLVYALLVSALLIAFRHHLVSIYSNDPAVLELAASLLLFIAVYQLLDDTQAVASGAMRGYKDTQMPMLYNLVGYWVIALPLGIALAFGWGPFDAIGVYGFWSGLTVGLALVAVTIGLRLYRTSRDPTLIARLARL